MYNTIIFDLDGTILNTTNGIIQSIQYALKELALNSLRETDYQNFIACSPLKKSFQKYCNLDDSTADKCCSLYKEYYAENAHNYTKIYDGIIDLLEHLKKENYKISIATFKDENNAKKIISYFKLDKYFDVIYGADIENKLTKADIIFKCLDKLDSNIKESVMIGDTLSDAQASQKVGMNFVGVTYGFGFKTKDEILPYNPILCADSVLEIINWFNEKHWHRSKV